MTLLASEAWSVVTPDGRPRCCVLMFIAIGDELIVGGMACFVVEEAQLVGERYPYYNMHSQSWTGTERKVASVKYLAKGEVDAQLLMIETPDLTTKSCSKPHCNACIVF